MGQHVRHAVPPAIFHVVVDRMIVPARGLKRREQRVGHGAAGQDEALADPEILEPAGFEALVPRRIEGVGHDCMLHTDAGRLPCLMVVTPFLIRSVTPPPE